MSREVTEADLMIAEKCGSYTINDLRDSLQALVDVDVAEAGMNAMIEATKEMTSTQRTAAAVWVIMNELLHQALLQETGDEAATN